MSQLKDAPRTSNIAWLFYKDYFKDENGKYIFREGKETENLIARKTENILNQKLVEHTPLPLEESLEFTTIYPGLLIGSGYEHEIGGVHGEFQLGFFFDHTTGMPIISGSSVKGVLRSAFKEPAYVAELLDEMQMPLSLEEINQLEIEVFGQSNGGDAVFKGQDIFFDAFIIKSNNFNDSFLDDDYITPHNDKYKDPIPLRFLKVSANVTFRFYFELSNGLLSKENKLRLFEKILLDLGVGAKANVGYGQFIGNNEKKILEDLDKKLKKKEEKEKAEALAKMSPVERVFETYDNNVTKVILAMKSEEIEEYEAIKLTLAQKVKEELQKDSKSWEKAKQKALKRKEFIESILEVK